MPPLAGIVARLTLSKCTPFYARATLLDGVEIACSFCPSVMVSRASGWILDVQRAVTRA